MMLVFQPKTKRFDIVLLGKTSGTETIMESFASQEAAEISLEAMAARLGFTREAADCYVQGNDSLLIVPSW